MNKRPILHVVPDVPELKKIKVDKVKRRAFKTLDKNFNPIDCIALPPSKPLSEEERRRLTDKLWPSSIEYETKEVTPTGTFNPPAMYIVVKDIID